MIPKVKDYIDTKASSDTPLFDEARSRYARFGTCDHEFKDVARIPKTNIALVDCSVCGKRLDEFRV